MPRDPLEKTNQEKQLAMPRYDLSPEELLSLEQEFVGEIKAINSEEGVTAAWIWPDHKYANVLRNHEAQLFPEVGDLSQDIEDRSLFFALVDTRDGTDRVVHASTVSGVLGRKAGEPNPHDPDGPVTSGFIVIDDLIEMGNFTVEDFWDYYNKMGVQLDGAISVETNFSVGERVDKFNGFKVADIAYLSLFKLALSRASQASEAAVFASINDDSIKSFGRVGLQVLPLMGRTDLVTSESEQGLDFKPVLILNTKENSLVFESIDTEVPEITFQQ